MMAAKKEEQTRFVFFAVALCCLYIIYSHGDECKAGGIDQEIDNSSYVFSHSSEAKVHL